jgi:aspartate kinase
MTVHKFGGAVLRSPGGFHAMADIVRGDSAMGCLVVVSAIGGTTRTLSEAAQEAMKGASNTSEDLLDGVLEAHCALADATVASEHERRTLRHALGEHADHARRLCRSVALTMQCSPRVLDRLLAIGEDMARTLAVASLQSIAVPASEVDARQLLVTDDQFGSASPLLEQTMLRVQQRLPPSVIAGHAWVTQGFVASTLTGETTTMGRESSNLSAAVLAASVKAEQIMIWTDVEGVRTADPALCDSTRVVEHLHYDQAHAAAAYGLKLIYPTMMEPAQRAGIRITIASPFDTHGASRTDIDGTSHVPRPLITVSANGSSSLVTVLFCPLGSVLDAAQRLLHKLPVAEHPFELRTNAHDHAATFVVHSDHLRTVVNFLHREICESTP